MRKSLLHVLTFLAAMLAFMGAGVAVAADEKLGPIGFFADLSADEQAETTESPGVGRADFLLDRDTVRLSWKVTYEKLTSAATGAHIHGPQRPGTNAGVQVDLAPNGLKPPLEGSVVLTDAQLEYLLAGRMYVNIHSQQYPKGELRGQIQRVPPKPQVTN
ncbi:MAG: CHRD domain-containing protein [Rhodospirillaceae bacterium]|nr:CHRD domain-containing protein [Rhodospirillaceae bacterium]